MMNLNARNEEVSTVSFSRRAFVTIAGSVLACFATRRAHAVPSTPMQEKTMEITRGGSQPSTKGPADWFTGTVRIDPLFQPHAPARTAAASVTFEPGARTAWHTHPLGQTLIITAGSVGCNKKAGRSRRYDLVTWSGSLPECDTGTGRARPRR